MNTMTKKSILASALISLGVFGLLTSRYSVVSMFLFAFGLFCICSYELNLFTGKCGYVLENKAWANIIAILIVNLIAGYLIGLFFRIVDPDLATVAQAKVFYWSWSCSYLLKSVFCGMIMFVAVDIFKKGSPLAILFGIPLFIFCGFQHSIANVIIMGCAGVFDSALILCIIGNWLGSLFVWWLLQN